MSAQKIANLIKEHEKKNKRKWKRFEEDQKKNSDKKDEIIKSNDAIECESKLRQVNEDISETNSRIKYECKVGKIIDKFCSYIKCEKLSDNEV